MEFLKVAWPYIVGVIVVFGYGFVWAMCIAAGDADKSMGIK